MIAMRITSALHRYRRLIGIGVIGLLAAGCGNPNSIAAMPRPVQQVVNAPTLSGNNIGVNMLLATGNQSYIGSGVIPGYYNFGPAQDQGSATYYVNFEIPVNLAGIEKRMGYEPKGIQSTTYINYDYINIEPLPNEAYDRLYYDPNTNYAPFRFKLNADGTIMDESWDAVAVNS